jgi:catechol 2,3-dioxygenase-like lactoylglutathione lyase family enzyme
MQETYGKRKAGSETSSKEKGEHPNSNYSIRSKLEAIVISGAHVIVYSKDAEADRVFFRDVLGFASVDAGHGWLIFALPPAEVAFHPAQENDRHELYFMCEDLEAARKSLAEKNVECSAVHEERWGSITKIRLPGGGEVALYQAKHPTALHLRPSV